MSVPATLQAHPEQRPSLILLDLSLPGMSGFEFLSWIKTDPTLRKTPVIVHAWDLGVAGYLQKPVSLEYMRRALRGLSRFFFGTVKLPPQES